MQLQQPKPLYDRIQDLKHKIDAYRPNGQLYRDGVYRAPQGLVNLLSVNGHHFTQIHQEFMSVLADEGFTRLSLEIQIKAIWSYMVMERFVRHWAHERNMTDGPAKIHLLNANAQAFRDRLNQFISDVNRNERRANSHIRERRRNAEHPRKHFHQKLLQIHNNIFAFNHDQPINQKVENSYFSNDVLSKASRMASAPRRRQNISQTEVLVNETVKRTLDAYPSTFEIEDARDYIEPKTGHELDLPFKNAFAVETDGPHHFQPDGAHEPVHHFKALALREAGFTRVPLDACLSEQRITYAAKQFGRLLCLEEVQQFHAQHQALVQRQDQIRELMIDITYKLRSEDIQEQEQAQLRQALVSLDQHEKAIRVIIQKRPLEKLFRDKAANPQDEIAVKLNRTFESIETIQRRIEAKKAEMAQRENTRGNYEGLEAYFRKNVAHRNIIQELEKLEREIGVMHPSNPIYEDRARNQQIYIANQRIRTAKEQVINLVRKSGMNQTTRAIQVIKAYWGIIHKDIDDQNRIDELDQLKFGKQLDLGLVVSAQLKPFSDEIGQVIVPCTQLIQQSMICYNTVKVAIEERRREAERLEREARERERERDREYERRMDRKRGRRDRKDDNLRGQKDHRRCREVAILDNYGRYRGHRTEDQPSVKVVADKGGHRYGGLG